MNPERCGLCPRAYVVVTLTSGYSLGWETLLLYHMASPNQQAFGMCPHTVERVLQVSRQLDKLASPLCIPFRAFPVLLLLLLLCLSIAKSKSACFAPTPISSSQSTSSERLCG